MVAECQGGDFLIKLFGKTIPVPEPESGDAKDLEQSSSSTEQNQDAHAQGLDKAHAHPDSPSDPSPPQPEIVDADEPKSPPETHRQKPSDGDAAGQRERLRKPDKVLPCPRCNSRDTKFCYFNNYNVNQPRHFCKRCQRYWTAGGAMRNVPVGAGCRKTKSAAAAAAASHFLHRVRPALPPACGGGGDTLETTNGGTVLSFGRNDGARPGSGPACLDLGLAAQLGHLAPVRNAGAPGPCSEGSIDRSSVVDESAANGDGAVQQHPASVNTRWPPYSGCSAPPLAAYFSSGIAIPIYSAAPGYWGCMVPGAWSLPWPQPLSSRSQGISSSSSSPTTTAAPSVSSSSGAADSHALGLGLGLGLGKHPRDRDGGDGRNGSAHGSGSAKVWAPKTIRIDDVDEVARSSIWSLIGIRGDKEQQDTGGTVFEPRRDATKKAMVTSSPFVHANPVALTRSVAFQEGS